MKFFKSQYKIIIITLALSLFAHAVVIKRFIMDGTLFTGKGDGLAQMIPFQMYLYEQFTHLNFFYDMGFGIGGDFFRSLSYYYSTSPIFYINTAVVYILDLILPLHTDTTTFWAADQVAVSIIKLAAIIYVTFRLLRYLGINRYSSMAASFLYSYSTVYFFFTMTWSFFSDVMLYLPLTIWGIERFFHERKVGLFITAIALTLHSNFYFSYYELIFTLFYFIYRVIYQKPSDVVNRVTKLKVIIPAVIISVFIAAVGFYTGVTSYLMNDRMIAELKLKPFIDFNILYNIFYNGYYVVIPFLTVMALSTFKLYRNYTFRLFAILTLLFFIGSLSPLFDSFFNGFSIDQRRWVYMLVFTSAVVIAVYLQHLKTLTLKELMISIIPVLFIYPLSVLGSKPLLWLIFIPVIIGLIMLYIHHDNRLTWLSINGAIVMMNVFFVYDYMTQQMDTLHPFNERNIDFMNSDNYNSAVQRSIVSSITAQSPNTRIDWQTSATHNTPLYQHFNGIKLYSSIFDKQIYKFYDKDLNITMDTDSNSIYYRLGERANLYSLFNVNHSIRTTNLSTLPYAFKLTDERSGADRKYSVFTNENKLPLVRVTDNVYDQKKLHTPIDREHAMLSGVVLNDKSGRTIKPTTNLISKVRVSLKDASLNGETLTVDKDQGGLVYTFDKQSIKKLKDLYIDLNIELQTPSKYHYVWINEIYQSRKPLDDDYRRFNPRITMRVKAAEAVHIKLMTGTYRIKVNGIYGEDYKILHQTAQIKNNHQLINKGSRLTVKLGYHKSGYVIIPTPYLNGMKATIDGQKTSISAGNYLMTAVKVNAATKEVIIKYTPPYFHLMQILSLIGIVTAFYFTRRVYKKTPATMSQRQEIDYLEPVKEDLSE